MRSALPTLLVLACASLLLSAQSPPLRTMRVDYFHTGGTTPEVFALDEVVIEPAPWPGPATATEDTLRYGAYGFDVRDAATKRIVHSAGFGSVFDEWVTTEDAKTASRTFHESVRFPAPSAPATVTIRKRGASNTWRDVWTTTVDPKDMFVNSAAPEPDPGAVIALQKNGDPARKVDLLLVGVWAAAGAGYFWPVWALLATALAAGLKLLRLSRSRAGV